MANPVNLSLEPVNVSKGVGETQAFVATLHWDDGTTTNVTGDCVWSSSDSGIASVTSGNVSTLKAGTATITAQYIGAYNPSIPSQKIPVVIEDFNSAPATLGGYRSWAQLGGKRDCSISLGGIYAETWTGYLFGDYWTVNVGSPNQYAEITHREQDNYTHSASPGITLPNGVMVRCTSDGDGYFLHFDGSSFRWGKIVGGEETQFAWGNGDYTVTAPLGNGHRWGLIVQGNKLTATFDGHIAARYTDAGNAFADGYVAVVACAGLGNSDYIVLDNFEAGTAGSIMSASAVITVTAGVPVTPPTVNVSALIIIPHGVNCNQYDNGGWLAPLWAPGNGELLGDLTPMNNWCRANGISIALNQDSQRSCKDMVDELATVGNSAPVYSGNRLKFIPYDEVSRAGYGAIYVAPTAAGPIADLSDKDFVYKEGELPIKINRKRRTDCDNIVSIEHMNRATDYAHSVTSEPYHAGVALYGPRKGGTLAAAELGVNNPSGSKALLSIHSHYVAQKISSILSKRGGIGVNVYTFTLKPEWFHLEAMDLVTLTDERLGYDKLPVRLTNVKENEDKSLECQADQFIYGMNHPNELSTTEPTGTLVDVNVSPGLTNTPLIFQPVSGLTGGLLQVWTLVSGADPAYGGSIVYMSVDGGETYEPVGRAANALMGLLAAEYPSSASPDTTNALKVDFTECAGSMSSAAQSVADALQNPCYIQSASGYELVCPTVATLTEAYNYTMSDYIVRGAYGTTIASHALGSRFAALGAAVRIDIPPSLIGVVLHFKFAAYNKVGGQATPLDQCTDYTFTVSASYGPQLFLVNGN